MGYERNLGTIITQRYDINSVIDLTFCAIHRTWLGRRCECGGVTRPCPCPSLARTRARPMGPVPCCHLKPTRVIGPECPFILIRTTLYPCCTPSSSLHACRTNSHPPS